MNCLHCGHAVYPTVQDFALNTDKKGDWSIRAENCANCSNNTFTLSCTKYQINRGPNTERFTVYPTSTGRSPVPSDVPLDIAEDYTEACKVLALSPKASAALSRRCLQNILHSTLNIRKANLYKEIQEAIDTNRLPTDISESLDYIRNIGNFAAHPIKSEHSGEIVAVEPEEAAWNLDVLELLFEYLYVRPAEARKKKDALNAKLKAAGKPEI